MPGAGLVVSKPKLGFGGLERILDRPAPPLDGDEDLNRRAGRAPRREEGELAVGQAAADQKAARPQPSPGGAIVARPEVGQLAIRPLVDALALGAAPRREPLPGALVEPVGDLLGGAGDLRLANPRVAGMGGVHSERSEERRVGKEW